MLLANLEMKCLSLKTGLFFNLNKYSLAIQLLELLIHELILVISQACF